MPPAPETRPPTTISGAEEGAVKKAATTMPETTPPSSDALGKIFGAFQGKMRNWIILAALLFLAYVLGFGTFLGMLFLAITILFAVLVFLKPDLLSGIVKWVGLVLVLPFGITVLVLFMTSAGIRIHPFFLFFILLAYCIVLASANKKVGTVAFFVLLIGMLVLFTVPVGISPESPIGVGLQQQKESFAKMGLWFKQLPSQISKAYQRQLAYATGDYYTGQVDAAARKQLGVRLEDIKQAQQVFYDNEQVSLYAKLVAQTLDKPIIVSVDCRNAAQANVFPKKYFDVAGYEEQDIDCVFEKGALKEGVHEIKLTADFEFTTRSYLKTYIMDKEELRQARAKEIDPLKAYPDKNPTAIYTNGPVRIGMSVGTQPVAISQTEREGPTLGITIENEWRGKITKLLGVYLFLPKGIEIADTGDKKFQQISCSALPAEEQPACDEKVVNVYKLSEEQLGAPGYKNITAFVSFRIPTKTNYAALGLKPPATPLIITNFKTSVNYLYQLEKTSTVTVRKSGTA